MQYRSTSVIMKELTNGRTPSSNKRLVSHQHGEIGLLSRHRNNDRSPLRNTHRCPRSCARLEGYVNTVNDNTPQANTNPHFYCYKKTQQYILYNFIILIYIFTILSLRILQSTTDTLFRVRSFHNTHIYLLGADIDRRDVRQNCLHRLFFFLVGTFVSYGE